MQMQTLLEKWTWSSLILMPEAKPIFCMLLIMPANQIRLIGSYIHRVTLENKAKNIPLALLSANRVDAPLVAITIGGE